jgi:hypothetical protein
MDYWSLLIQRNKGNLLIRGGIKSLTIPALAGSRVW